MKDICKTMNICLEQKHFLKPDNFSISDSHALINALRKNKFKDGLSCAYCNSHHIVKYGTRNGKQRYRCKRCSRTFMDLTFTPIYRTHYLNKWIPFIEYLIKGFSLRKSAKLLGVSWVTLFYWRHKILVGLGHIPIEAFKGIVEMEDMYISYSEKGNKHISLRNSKKRGEIFTFARPRYEKVCVLVAMDRRPNIFSKVTSIGRVLEKQIERNVGSFLSPDNVICSFPWRGYMNFARQRKIPYKVIYHRIWLKETIPDYNIDRSLYYTKRFKKWLDTFRGVASKYLNSYLAWFKYLYINGFNCTYNSLMDMLITACSYKTYETFDSLRLAVFDAPRGQY